MQFFIPVKLISDTNCIANHKSELAKLGTKALIVTGRSSSKKNGSLKDTTDVLEQLKIPYLVFDEIEENPSVETVMKAREVGVDFGADFVIGIGGGSPLDASKAISMMMKHTEYGAEVLYDGSKVLDAYPVASVPTTAGTGSEATPYAILTQHNKRTKQSLPHKIFPQVAFVDEKYLSSVQKKILIDTAVDTLAHLIESYINTNATSYSEMFALRGLELWGAHVKQILLKDTTTPEDRAVLFEASSIGGMAISHTGTSLPHALSYKITYEIGMPHGRAVGIFLPNYVKYCPIQEKVDKVLALLGFANVEEFASYIELLFGSVSIEESLMEENAAATFENKGKLKNCPYSVDFDMIHKITQI